MQGLVGLAEDRTAFFWRIFFIVAFYLFKKLLVLYWSIVDLQCCVSFRYTAK